MALASNLPFSEWGSVIADPRLVAAIVDRVTFNAHIIETGSDSYRLRTTKTRQKRTSQSPAADLPGFRSEVATTRPRLTTSSSTHTRSP